jgi:predicted dehydrogenase
MVGATPARLRVAVVGAGSMGSLHARVVAQAGEADLVAVVDPAEDAGCALADRLQTAWLPDVVDFSRFDAAIVASPTPTHHEWIRRVLLADVPLLVEKPAVADLDVLRELLALSARRGVPMMCGFVERFNPAVAVARDAIGEAVHLSAVRHSPYAPRVRTGVGTDLLIHDLDLALGFGRSPVVTVRAAHARCHPDADPGEEDVAEVLLEFESGMLASLSASRLGQRKVRTLTVTDLERAVEVDLIRQDVTVYRHVGAADLGDGGPGYRQQTVIDVPFVPRPGEPLALQFRHFCRLVRGEHDADAERATILPPHELMVRAQASARG